MYNIWLNNFIYIPLYNYKTMSKLNLDALKERAEVIASTELLASITGGNENACYDNGDRVREMREKVGKNEEV